MTFFFKYLFISNTRILIYYNPLLNTYNNNFFVKMKKKIIKKIKKIDNIIFVIYHITNKSSYNNCNTFRKKLIYFFPKCITEIKSECEQNILNLFLISSFKCDYNIIDNSINNIIQPEINNIINNEIIKDNTNSVFIKKDLIYIIKNIIYSIYDIFFYKNKIELTNKQKCSFFLIKNPIYIKKIFINNEKFLKTEEKIQKLDNKIEIHKKYLNNIFNLKIK